jgi:hypothetical protein
MELCDKLQGKSLSFLIVLGGFIQSCTKANHDYFKSEYVKKCRLPFPVFFVSGDRDVLYDEMNADMDEDSFERALDLTELLDHYKVDYVISADGHGCTRTTQGNTTYLVADNGTVSSPDKKIAGGAHHALVFTVHSDSVPEEIVLARRRADIGGAARHFAMAKLFPFLKKHLALTIVENLLILGVFCAFLRNVIRVRKTQMVDSWCSC